MSIIDDTYTSPSPLEVLRNASFDVYTGGSRRAAQLAGTKINGVQVLTPREQEYQIVPTSSTDFDFYATYTPDVEEYLRNSGFTDTEHSHKCRAVRDGDGVLHLSSENIPSGYNLDSEAVMILERSNVQIVLRKDAEFYRKVFENIPTEFYYRYLWKSSPECVGRQHIQPIFNALFAIAHAMQNK